jgi:hypothetical protein
MENIEQKYWDLVSKFKTKLDLDGEIKKLEMKLEQMRLQGMRAARRAEDAGPMDIMWERMQPIENRVNLLKWFVKNPKKLPPKDIMDIFASEEKSKEEHNEYKKQRQEKLSKFPSMVGGKISFKDRSGKIIIGTVIKQIPGKYSDEPKYKTDIGWTVPHALVKKFDKPTAAGATKIADELKKKKDLSKSMKSGQSVEWNSIKAGGSKKGEIVSVGRSKIKVQVGLAVWTVPISLITKVDGKNFK